MFSRFFSIGNGNKTKHKNNERNNSQDTEDSVNDEEEIDSLSNEQDIFENDKKSNIKSWNKNRRKKANASFNENPKNNKVSINDCSQLNEESGNDNDDEEEDDENASVEVDSLDDKSCINDNPLLPEELCEIPTFLNTECCDKSAIEETRRRLKKKYLKRPESFNQDDYDRMLVDDWTVSRFLLRCRLNPKRAARLMEQCGKFRREFKMGTSQLKDFPIEFHRAGGLFRYAPDRVGNETLFMRVKMHRRVPELSQIMKEFILCCLEECDKANNGRGTAVIFDLTNCGLQNVDPGFLFWLVFSFRNYCPKGLSYIIVYNLPWILNATAKLALSWLSSTNKRRLRFVSGDAIQDFIAPENLPDYLGGTCKIDYRHVPEGARLAEDTAEEHNLTREQSRKLREVYEKFLKDVDSDIKLDKGDYEEHQDLDNELQDRNLKEGQNLKAVESTQTAASLISSHIVAS